MLKLKLMRTGPAAQPRIWNNKALNYKWCTGIYRYLFHLAVDDDEVSFSLQTVLPAVVPIPPLWGYVVTTGAKHHPVLWTANVWCLTSTQKHRQYVQTQHITISNIWTEQCHDATENRKLHVSTTRLKAMESSQIRDMWNMLLNQTGVSS